MFNCFSLRYWEWDFILTVLFFDNKLNESNILSKKSNKITGMLWDIPNIMLINKKYNVSLLKKKLLRVSCISVMLHLLLKLWITINWVNSPFNRYFLIQIPDDRPRIRVFYWMLHFMPKTVKIMKKLILKKFKINLNILHRSWKLLLIKLCNNIKWW